MPLYNFVCTGCSERERKLLKPGEQIRAWECSKCGASLRREPKPPTTQMLESLDNGAMVRRVERLQNAEELYRDRAKNDPRNKPV